MMSCKQIHVDDQGGFTLVELMFVIAIIGIIASTALPQFSHYRDRAYVAEALTLPQNIQLDVGEYYGHHGRFPATNAALGVPEPEQLIGSTIDQIEVAGGAVHIRFTGSVAERIRETDIGTEVTSGATFLSLRPSIAETATGGVNVIWLCGYAEPLQGLTVYGENKTNVQRESLPIVCW